jgi:hypothetical protein
MEAILDLSLDAVDQMWTNSFSVFQAVGTLFLPHFCTNYAALQNTSVVCCNAPLHHPHRH